MPVVDLAGKAAFRELLGTRAASDHDVRTMAKEAADRYLQDKVDPNSTIEKFAEERDLNPQFIARVAEAANVVIYSELFKKASPEDRASIEFPLARGPEITRTVVPPDGPTLQVKEAAAKEAAAPADLDYMVAPPSVLRRPHVAEPMEKAASAPIPHPTYVRNYLEKLSTQRQNQEGEALVALQALDAAESAFIKEAKHLLVTDPSALADVYRDACHLGLGKVAAELIAKTSETAPSLRIKIAAMVPEDYLPDEDAARVVNGETKILKLLRAVDQRRADVDDRWQSLRVVDHGRERMIERVRDLSS